MKILFYLTAAVCFIGWAVSVFVYSATDLIHSLLAFVAIFITMGIIKDDHTLTTPSESEFKL